MHRTPLSYIISICLFAIFSSSALAQTALEANADSVVVTADEWMLRAALCEREVYAAEDPAQANDALLAKAECCREAGEYREAIEALGRVRMYLLSAEERTDILKKKAELEYLSGGYDAAISYLGEAGIKVDVPEVKHKSDWAGMFLTFIVPAGYAYAGAPFGEAAVGTALNAASVVWTVTQIMSGCYVSGILGGAIALSSTFFGAQERVGTLIEQHNAAAETAAKRDAINKALDK